jgi:rare lipoprotein A
MTSKAGLAAMGAALMVLGIGAQDVVSTPAAAAEPHRAAPHRSPVPRQHAQPPRPAQAQRSVAASRGHQVQRGRASYYGAKFNGRRMANGARYNPNSNVAAHRTLPLGTRAQVTNLENGRTTEVRVEDRGPYVGGRVIDLTPRSAEHLGMREQGTAPVEVRPIEVPERDQRVAER